MLFKCKDTSFFSNMEGFLIFFVILHANLRVFVQMAKGNRLFRGGNSLLTVFSRSRYIVFSLSKYLAEFKNKIYN